MSTHLKYLSSFFFPICVLVFLYTGPHHMIAALLWTLPLWFLILLDWLSPKIDPKQKKHIVCSGYYNTILYILALFQFLNISLLVVYASKLQWHSSNEVLESIVNLIVLRILVGTTSGSSAIIVAHEFIHRPQPFMRLLGHFLLYTVCYDHFVIAHLRGHHNKVATPDDIATARLGENFEDYWKRVLFGHFRYAWNSELERLNLEHLPFYHYKMLSNFVLQGLLIEFTLVLLIGVFFGWAATFIFLYQAYSGVRLLETINYYQHWGLEQGRLNNHLAWNNQSSLSEYALIGLPNHREHHHHATTPFYEINYSDLGPMMRYGYFVTNLWVKLHNESFRRASSQILQNHVKFGS